MTEVTGTSGLIFNEPLLWEKGSKGRNGFSIPKRDVTAQTIDENLKGDVPDFPDLSEPEVVRHFTRLSQWNFSVDSGMYPLGSCTMKYNPKINEKLAATKNLASAHPLLPQNLSQGILKLIYDLEHYLAEITGMSAISLQPSAGAHGELAGMMIFSAYHKSMNKLRSKILIPDTAHGTNPASAALCGFKAVPAKSNDKGLLSHKDIEALMDEDTAGIMITNPNTLGLFESDIKKIAETVHAKGGLVYADGANMNAVMGIVDIADLGVDVLHLNLHKTFSTPHGGGGPGSGPVCVVKKLEKFLPTPRVFKDGEKYILKEDIKESIGRLHAFYGNVGVLIKAYSYILSMGADNLKKASQLAVLNANYIKESLKGVYHLPYDAPCMHECVFSDKFQHDRKIATLDIAKRLMDYGFHPPTIYFPLIVEGAIMIEPTETECKETLDEFIDALKRINIESQGDYVDLLHAAPLKAKVERLDEVAAARNPKLAG